jgi:hypothetical protein
MPAQSGPFKIPGAPSIGSLARSSQNSMIMIAGMKGRPVGEGQAPSRLSANAERGLRRCTCGRSHSSGGRMATLQLDAGTTQKRTTL